MGISGNTRYSKLSPHKVDQLNLLLSLYRKKTSPFFVTSNVVTHANLPLGSSARQAEVESTEGQGNKDYLMLPFPFQGNPIGSPYGVFPEGNEAFGPSSTPDPKLVMGEKILHSPILSSLDEFKKENIKILITLNALRGRRLKQGYPVRGQRTRSNAKTARRLNRMYN